jgi:hypothetical protein
MRQLYRCMNLSKTVAVLSQRAFLLIYVEVWLYMLRYIGLAHEETDYNLQIFAILLHVPNLLHDRGLFFDSSSGPDPGRRNDMIRRYWDV